MKDSFNASVTSVEYEWPAGLTGIERIMLAASGDLQRLLSAFFAQPITIERVFAETSPRTQAAAPQSPITQKRRVHLLCQSRIACIATSTVTITSPECEHLFLEEKYAIGQLFRRMLKVPQFNLLDVGFDEIHDTGSSRPVKRLWRRYTLHIDGFQCEIKEEFPDRRMFVQGQRWLDGQVDDEDTADTSSSTCSDTDIQTEVVKASSSTGWFGGLDDGHIQVLLICLTIVLLSVMAKPETQAVVV